MHIASADYTTFKTLKTFSDKDELNKTVRSFLYNFKHEITPSAAETLKIVSRFAVKVPGVCWTKIDTIATKIEKSSRTVQRSLKLLEDLGIITRKNTMRKNGGYGHPVIVINPRPDLSFPGDVASDVTSELSPRQESTNVDNTSIEEPKNGAETKISETKSSRENKYKELRNTDSDKINIDYTFVDNSIPGEFVEHAKNKLSPLEIDEFWKKVKIATKKVNSSLINETDIAIRALKTTIKAYKKQEIHTTLGGYFYKTALKMMQSERDSFNDFTNDLAEVLKHRMERSYV